MKKIVIPLTALAGVMFMSGCAYDYYDQHGYGYGHEAYGYGHNAYYGHLAYGDGHNAIGQLAVVGSPGTATVVTTYGTPLANSAQLSAGVAAAEATPTQPSEATATERSAGEDARKAAAETAGQTP